MIRALISRWTAPRQSPRANPLEGWALRSRGRLHLHAARDQVSALKSQYPDLAAATVTAAERALDHEFDLLGTGAFIARDPDRRSDSAYAPIDWRYDPRSGQRFPAGFPSERWSPAMCPPGADIKLPWELGRAQHLVTLAQAFMLTGDERFRREVRLQCEDFVEGNPVGKGVQWICTMDVALRAVSWALAADALAGDDDDREWRPVYDALFRHGLFIRSHLENTFEVTSNHFLSNLVGLLFLGCVFRVTSEGTEWREFARQGLEGEIRTQVLPDGADFESSVPYHRLVAELFLTSLRAAELGGVGFSAEFRARTRAMLAFHYAVLRPDGGLPQVGDGDDGRAHVLTATDAAEPQRGLHLLGPAAAMFDEPVWRHGSDAARWEAAWWGLPPEGEAGSTLADSIRLFAEAGLAVARRGGHYLLITNGPVGTRGFGNHKHNDQLSFECHLFGEPLIVDPGSYVYTGDPASRNAFRSTRSHNTLQVDGIEQHDFKPEWLFRLFESGRPAHVAFSPSAERMVYRGSFDGYGRLADPLTHERAFDFDVPFSRLTIEDVVSGRGEHRLVWRFHCAPGVVVRTAGGAFELGTAQRRFLLAYPADLEARVDDAWYSPSYGVRHPARVIVCERRISLEPHRPARWSFALAPAGPLQEPQT
jgi:hypothetical protein